MKFLNSLQPVALLALRMAFGLIFLTHGYPKIAKPVPGMFTLFVQHGLPGYFVYVAGVLETFGGLLLIAGLFTRAAGMLLAAEMVIAVLKIHSGGGILAVHNYEFPLSLAAGCFALSAVGPGVLSLDAIFFAQATGKPRTHNAARR